jgi:hypothetical protein
MARERLDVKQAAYLLGVSTDAIHKRVRRGTLESEKDAEGRVYVWIDNGLDEDSRGGYTSTDGARQDVYTPPDFSHELLEALRSRIRFLEVELEDRKEESRRKDAIIMTMAQRIPELEPAREASPEPRGSSTPPSEEEGKGETPPDTERRSWWRRLFE